MKNTPRLCLLITSLLFVFHSHSIAAQNSVLESNMRALYSYGEVKQQEDGSISMRGFGPRPIPMAEKVIPIAFEKLSVVDPASRTTAPRNIIFPAISQSTAMLASKSLTTLEEIDIIFDITLDAVDEIPHLYHFSIGKESHLAGTSIAFEGDENNGNLILNRRTDGEDIFVKRIPLPFPIAVGEKFTFRIGKRVRNLEIEIASANHLYFNNSYVFSINPNDPFFGCLWGNPYLEVQNGTITVSRYHLETPYNTSPKLAVWGDSITEGNSLDDISKRYLSYAKNAIGHDQIAIMGRGGESSSSIASRFDTELAWFKGAKYAMLAVGVNDQSFYLWKKNILGMIEKLKKNNITPILVTLTPRTDRLEYIEEVNKWIRYEFGNLMHGTFFDPNAAVATCGNKEGGLSCMAGYEWWSPDSSLGDRIHPSYMGHAAIFNQMLAQLPFLFDGHQQPEKLIFAHEEKKEEKHGFWRRLFERLTEE